MVEFIVLPFRTQVNLKCGHLTSLLCRDGKEKYKKAWCTSRVVVLLIKPIAFWRSPCRCRCSFVTPYCFSAATRHGDSRNASQIHRMQTKFIEVNCKVFSPFFSLKQNKVNIKNWEESNLKFRRNRKTYEMFFSKLKRRRLVVIEISIITPCTSCTHF